LLTTATATAALYAAAGPVADGALGGNDTFAGFIGGAAGPGSGQFTEPSDAATYLGESPDGADDELFVVEAGGARVQRLDAAGNSEQTWGRRGTRAGEFVKPTGVAVSQSSGDVYVMDLGNRRVQQFDGNGGFVRTWGWGVATGGAAFEVCKTRCRPGRIGGPEGNDNPGQFADSVNGAIAVSPADGDLFVTDGANRRVLQFDSTGGFVRGWGRGVSTGSRRFESCTASDCRRGVAVDLPEEITERSWPRHVAVGRDGVVYTSEASGGDRILRFDPAATNEPDIEPLTAGRPLTSGITSGLEVSPRDGNVVVVRNAFGPIVVDVVRRPSAPLDAPAPPRASRIEVPSYLDSVNGLAVTRAGGVALVKSSKLNRRDPPGSLNDCHAPDGPRPCQGLALLSAGPAGENDIATTAPTAVSATAATLNGVVVPNGVVRSRFELSTDGKRWRGLGPARYVTGPVSVPAEHGVTGLRPATPYLTRLVVEVRSGLGERRVLVASERAFVTESR
jgi:DNA-binding beta-propeller fold protein YncE